MSHTMVWAVGEERWRIGEEGVCGVGGHGSDGADLQKALKFPQMGIFGMRNLSKKSP